MIATPDRSQPVAVRKVKIDPLGCYRQAFALVAGRYWLLLGISAVGMLIGGAVPVALMGPMMAGIYLCFLDTYRDRDFEFARLFDGFDHFVPSLIAGLIITGITLLLVMPFIVIMLAGMILGISAAVEAGQADGGQAAAAAPAIFSGGALFILSLVFVALIIVVSMFFTFTFPLIVDRGLTGPRAIAVSARAVARNLAGMLGLTLIGTVLGILGVLACYVGSFFIMPISLAAMTIAYRKLFPELEAEPPPSPG